MFFCLKNICNLNIKTHILFEVHRDNLEKMFGNIRFQKKNFREKKVNGHYRPFRKILYSIIAC